MEFLSGCAYVGARMERHRASLAAELADTVVVERVEGTNIWV